MDKKIKKIKVLSELTNQKKCNEGFLQKKHFKIVNIYENNEKSREYYCDVVFRKQADAVGIVIFIIEEKIQIVLRKCLRPPMLFREEVYPNEEMEPIFILEIPAGILEEGEENLNGINARAVIEIYEETGLKVDTSRIFSLGAPIITSPGMTYEKVYLRAVKISRDEWNNKEQHQGDGSPMEDGGELELLELDQAIRLCYNGEIGDGKTELALYRFKEFIKKGDHFEIY